MPPSYSGTITSRTPNPSNRCACAPLCAREIIEMPGFRLRALWIASNAVLPSIQHYLLIDASRKDGVSLGDQFTLMRGRVELDRGVRLPEQPVALAQVVRVTERGATVMIVDQVQPKVREGMEARLTAKMP